MQLVTRNWQAKPLGMYLVEAGILTPGRVEPALEEQQKSGRRLGEILVTRGWVEQQTIEYLMEKVVLPERTQPYSNQNSSQKLNAFEQVSRAEQRRRFIPTFELISLYFARENYQFFTPGGVQSNSCRFLG